MKTSIHERPIIFSSEMVRAILDGRKTQTRRVMKTQPLDGRTCVHFDGRRWYTRNTDEVGCPIDSKDWKCPYGVPGDRLWVRETWHKADSDKDPMYRADFKSTTQLMQQALNFRWKPSIYMPRKFSRITLEIVGVRVERVQEITCQDCWAEGVDGSLTEHELNLADKIAKEENGRGGMSPYEKFRILWNPINAKRDLGWDVNPWVFVIEFKHLNP